MIEFRLGQKELLQGFRRGRRDYSVRLFGLEWLCCASRLRLSRLTGPTLRRFSRVLNSTRQPARHVTGMMALERRRPRSVSTSNDSHILL